MGNGLSPGSISCSSSVIVRLSGLQTVLTRTITLDNNCHVIVNMIRNISILWISRGW